ncbi:hypothetical protein D3C86_1942290 [compost metagenome]
MYTSTPPASVMVGVALRLRTDSLGELALALALTLALTLALVDWLPGISRVVCPAGLIPAVGKPMVGSTRPAVASSITTL